jgi:hypothetical protein
MIWSATTSRRTAPYSSRLACPASKDGIDRSEYIFARYAAHVGGAIFFESLPDMPASLPQYSPRTR